MNRKARRGSTFRRPSASLRLDTLKRIAIYSILTIILGSAQCAFFPTLDICPRTPDLIMGLILAVALCDNIKSAMALSVGAGFFIDAVGGGAIAFSPIVYLVYAVIIGLLSQKMLKSFPSYLILLLPSLAYRAVVTFTLSLILGSASFGGGLFITVLLEALSTFILCLGIYPITNLATKPLRSHKKFSF